MLLVEPGVLSVMVTFTYCAGVAANQQVSGVVAVPELWLSTTVIRVLGAVPTPISNLYL